MEKITGELLAQVGVLGLMRAMKIGPQKGKQAQFMSSSADIVIYGGAMGGGKTYSLLLEAVRHADVKNYTALLLRREMVQVTNPGGLWDTALNLYPKLGGIGKKKPREYRWPHSNARITFSYLDKVEAWQGAQIALICFDELTHFSKAQFFYMLSRNRSECGIRPYIRATTNPDPDSWVRGFIDWWIGKDGYAIEERSGVIRWFVHQNDQIFWFDTKKKANAEFPNIGAKSCTFINSRIFDNEILMRRNPEYLDSMQAQNAVERERNLEGNWDIRAKAGDYFDRSQFEVVDKVPRFIDVVRCWDLASTKPSELNPNPDWTVGLKAGVDPNGIFYILDMVRVRLNPADVKTLVRDVADRDGRNIRVRIPQDPGSAGKVVAHDYVRALRGYTVKHKYVTGSKLSRVLPASSQVGIGNVKVLRAKWNSVFFNEMEGFPDAVHDDIVDAFIDCMEELSVPRGPIRLMNIGDIKR